MERSSPSLVRRRWTSRRQTGWDALGRRVLDHPGGLLRVLGGPGTGKTTLIAETVADRIRGGVDPESVLVLTAGRPAAQALRSRIATLLTAPDPERGLPRTAREPMVRTLHSYAFAVLRAYSDLAGLPQPRLLPVPDQDAMIRELLRGDVADGAPGWPAALRPALLLPDFAAELRDLLLRTAERGLGPEDLITLGERHGRPEWTAAGRFGQVYEEIAQLGATDPGADHDSGPALDAAELVAQALLTLETEDDLLAAEHARVRHLIVDDAQHLDPQQFRLIRLLGDQAKELILAGDPDQSVFSFRGADPRCLLDADPDGDRTVVLTVDHRMSPAVRGAVRRLTARLPGAGPQRELRAPAAPDELAPEFVDDALPPDPFEDEPPPDPFEEDLPPDPFDGEPPPDDVGTAPPPDLETAVFGRVSEEADPTGPRLPLAPDGVVQVRLLASAAQEAAWVADQLRRARLLHGVPWSEMAVIVRSAARSLPVLRRALLAAGVPMTVPLDEVPLAEQPAVRPLLELLRCADQPSELNPDIAAMLLGSPLGGADALAQRRIRRELRRLALAAGVEKGSGDLLVEVLNEPDRLAGMNAEAAAPVQAVATLLSEARTAIAEGSGVEEVLWRVWQASDLERHWLSQTERRGPAAAQADRDLDAVLALFDAAARHVERRPGLSVGGFVERLRVQRIPGDSLAPRAPQGESVAVLTAHAAAGREWTVVAVPGVQEGSWPDLRLRGSLLGVERLIDVLTGMPYETVSATAPLLAEERRLLVVAASRARHTLLVSAVRGEDEQPSRFLDELDDVTTDSETEARPLYRPPRGLSLPELVGELRRVVCDPLTEPDRRERAARALARLAAERVPGSDPRSWYGLADASTDAPLWVDGDQIRVSPSTVDVLTRCPTRWVVERHGGQDQAELASITGTLVHALVQAAGEGADRESLRRGLDEAWAAVDAGAPWFSRRERRRIEAMLDSFLGWFTTSRSELSQLAVEHDMDVSLPADPEGLWLRIRGRVDRLDSDAQGRPVVIDVKTSRGAVSAKDAEEHPQLAVYQLAASLGAFRDLGADVEPGGARLLYVAKPDGRTGAATERVQPPLDAEGVARWRLTLAEAAESSRGPSYAATENADCTRCPVRTSCALHPSGRQVSE
ncbi:superfamily I DNA/RNA helicase/RecB family exonuclease [Actinoalloteichus hoggarensis]|uniref:ATP-dependent helicase n=1 Tax=Actinoalloteichus hoggarensis TaxID=1470176 RepID=UPI0018021E48|nr:superfamily I DNA/RNA helicase/RecB family exonuclease [Actinoalloteichus hoggarensis]